MREVLEIVLAIFGFSIGMTALGTGLALRRVRHLNRVSPLSPTEAPLHWLSHPGRPAQLHRRLRRAARLVIAATQPPTPPRRRRRPRETGVLDGAGRELVRRAVVLDSRIVACDRGGQLWRRRQLPDLERDVAVLERSAARLASLSLEMRRHLDELDVVGRQDQTDLELGLDAMEAALGELRAGSPEPVRRIDGAAPRRAR